MKSNWLVFKKQYWEVRSEQERGLIKYIVWALVPVLVYFILWQPAHVAVQKLRVGVPMLYAEAERLRVHADEIVKLRNSLKPATLNGVAMKLAIEDSAARNNLKELISTIDLQEPNGVHLAFASVSFEVWLHWLRSLQQEQHIRADSVSVSMLPQLGMVKISTTFINGDVQ